MPVADVSKIVFFLANDRDGREREGERERDSFMGVYSLLSLVQFVFFTCGTQVLKQLWALPPPTPSAPKVPLKMSKIRAVRSL